MKYIRKEFTFEIIEGQKYVKENEDNKKIEMHPISRVKGAEDIATEFLTKSGIKPEQIIKFELLNHINLKLPEPSGKHQFKEQIEKITKYIYHDYYDFKTFSNLLVRFNDKHTYEFITEGHDWGVPIGYFKCDILKDIQNQSYYKKAVLIYAQ